MLLNYDNIDNQDLLDFNENYAAHFIKNNGLFKYQINDKLDVSVQIQSSNELELRDRINKTFDIQD